jgi:hypothetical protein
MDKTNPLMAFDKSNSDIDRLKKDILDKNITNTINSNEPSSSTPAKMDFRSMFDKQKEDEISLFDQDINIQATHKQVGDELLSKYPAYRKGIDNNEFYAQRQTTGEKWANGLQKFGLKTGTAALGGTVGFVTGLINAAEEGSLTAMYTDDFNTMLDDYNEKLDFKLPNYYTEQERDAGFLKSVGSHNFWANDFLGGLSFTMGMVVSEGIWAAATGGTSLIARGASNIGKIGRWSTKVLGSKKALTGLAKYKAPVKKLINKTTKADLAALKTSAIQGATTAKLLNQARFIGTSSFYEAGVESRHYLKEMEDEWIMNFQKTEGRNPNSMELGDFYNETSDTGNAVFLMNGVLVGSSNMAVFGKMLLGRSTKAATSNSAISRELFGVGYNKIKGGGYEAIKANTRQKVAGKVSSILKPMLVEGVYEEGGQSVASKSVKDYVLSGYDEEATKDNLSLISSAMKGFNETYGTKEGRKEVGLGMIIGLFGGGMATGGRFNEMSQKRKNIKQQVDYRNASTPSSVLAVQMAQQRIITNNKILSATRKQKKAADRNDMTTEYLSEQQAIIASIERDSAFQGTKQGIEDFEAYLETVNNKELAEEMGMENEGEAKTWKEDKLAEYKNLSKRYSQNEKYVRAVVGDQDFAGASKINTNSEQIIKAITYNMTLGEQSKEFTTKIVEDIKMAIAGEVSFETFTNSIEVDQALSNSSREAVTKYMDLSKKVKELNRQKSAIERKLLSEQGKKGQLTPEQHASKLQGIQEQILEIDDKIAEIKQNKDAAFRTLGIEDDVITQDDLDSQAENVAALGDKIEGYKNTNPQLHGTLTKLFEEYGKAKSNTVSFNKMTQELLDPTIRVDVISGWLSEILKKGKSLDESTKEFFKEQLNNYETNQVQGKAGSDAAVGDKTQTDQPEEEEQVEKTEGDEMTDPEKTTTKPEVKTPLQMIKQKISDIMGKNIYTTTYIGNDFDEAVKNKPSEEDVNRYEELVNKINSTYITKFTQLLSAPKGWHKKNNKETGLTVEEVEELKEIQNKLSNWKVLEGSIEDDSTVADLILLAEQLETEVEKSNTKTEITEEEYETIKQSPEKELKDEKYETSEGVQSPDQVLVSIIDIDGEPTYTFSHLAVESLAKLFPDSTLEIVQGKVSKPLNEITQEKLTELSKQKGTVFLLRTPEGDIKVTVGRRSRLNISKKSLDKSLENSNIAIIKYGSGTFRDVYEKLENGDMIPLRGDFTYASEIEGEHIELLPEVVNNVTEGQILITRLNKNDSYNKALFKKYSKSKKTEEDLNDLMNDLHIYITDQTGRMIGSLRASKTDLPDTDATKNLLELRRKAVKMYLDKSNEGLFSINESIPVKTVLVGSPNFIIEEGKPKSIDFTDTSLEQVEDVGYFEGDTLHLKKMDEGEIIKTFLPKTSSLKMPIVILKVNGKSVAFPVTLKSTTVDRASEAQEILDTDLSEGDKVSRINAILIDSGLKPVDYAVNKNGGVSINEEKVLNDLATIESFPNLVDWISPSYKLETLKEQAQIGIDLDNNPFNLSKVMLDLSKTKTFGKVDQIREKYDDIENREIQVRKGIQAAVAPIIEGMNNYPGVDNVRWTDALFYEGELDKNPKADVDYRKNVNTLRKALYKDGKKVSPPKAVRETYGEEFIENLRKNIEELDRITETKKKTRADIKDAKVEEEVKNQKESC